MARSIDGTKATKDVMEYSRKLQEAGNADAAGYVMWAASIVGEQPTIDPEKHGYVSKEVLDQIRWERDIAMSYLEEAGVGFGEKAELQRVKHGKWVKRKKNMQCSECGKEEELTEFDHLNDLAYDIYSRKRKWCSYCGARMDGE